MDHHPTPTHISVAICHTKTITLCPLKQEGLLSWFAWPFSVEKLRHRDRNCRLALSSLSEEEAALGRRVPVLEPFPAPPTSTCPSTSQDALRGSEEEVPITMGKCTWECSQKLQEVGRFKNNLLGPVAHQTPRLWWVTTPGQPRAHNG